MTLPDAQSHPQSHPQSHYDVLEVSPRATLAEVREAYERAQRQLGPDSLATYALLDPSEREALLRRLDASFAVLRDPQARREYDLARGLGDEVALATPPSPSPSPEPSVLEAVASPAPAPPAEAPLAPTVPPKSEVKPEAKPEVEVKVDPAPAPREPPRTIRKTEAELPPDAPVTGDALRRVREACGLTIKELELRTKIGHWHLTNIEGERYSALPVQVYLRGFLMSIARELKLDPIRVSRGYVEQMAKAKDAAK